MSEAMKRAETEMLVAVIHEYREKVDAYQGELVALREMVQRELAALQKDKSSRSGAAAPKAVAPCPQPV